jgi:hypothetical protein
LRWIDHYGAIGAAVALEIALTVAFDVQVVDFSWTGGAEDFAVPGDVLGETDVQGDQFCGRVAPFGGSTR